MASITAYASARRIEDQDIPASTDTIVSWQEVSGDSDGFFNLNADPTIATIQKTGVYFVVASAKWSNTTNARSYRLFRNGNPFVDQNSLANQEAYAQVFYLGKLDHGDVLHIQAFNGVVSTISPGNAGEDHLFFGLFFLGPV